ncbi:hypothetical protein DPX16_19662 [Anabarilius grahami]|uniref:Uncharacterized protein n=1 Tax=Anabarilius grahami TaxID=495550 RepID=A0A3N0XKS4_ANAGA|nr:hypothetical protein DPX16_19662 [Anabarilius grahami]
MPNTDQLSTADFTECSNYKKCENSSTCIDLLRVIHVCLYSSSMSSLQQHVVYVLAAACPVFALQQQQQ